jgi:murein DD-endopeptidase MepM/ murein hydrolase activator NlpD
MGAHPGPRVGALQSPGHPREPQGSERVSTSTEIATRGWIPLPVTSPYGPRVNAITGRDQFHTGIDIGIPMGTPVVSIAPGRVVSVLRDDPISGHAVVVEHAQGWGGVPGPIRSSYVHLSMIRVVKGEEVPQGMPLGRSGGAPGTPGAGRSTGPHLHLGMRSQAPDGTWVAFDPVPMIDWAPHQLIYPGGNEVP